MPGIVGIITKMPREQAQPRLCRMLETMRHEPFYRTGTWSDEARGVYLGWTARSEAFDDGMPLVNETRDRVLVFSGEEYPNPDLMAELRGRGHSIGPSPCSYLVHVSEEDPQFPLSLNGRFHGVLVDSKSGRVTLFNDRFGIHRVYYHETQDAFYFAAEAKAILAVCPELRSTDPRSLGEFISCGCVLENRTLFRDLHVLPPASAWVFQGSGKPCKQSYFDPKSWEQAPQLEPDAYYQRVREVFSRVLPRYFAGSQPVGMSLTGGLDSRIIMAWQDRVPGALPCYSFGGMFRDCHDVKIARSVAKACGQTHQTIPVGEEFLKKFPHYAERTVYLSDGCVDTAHSPDLFVNERAAQIAPVRMTGNYGGEVLRQVRAFKPMRMKNDLFGVAMLPQLEQARATYQSLIDGHPLSFAVFRQAPWHHYGLLSLGQTQLTLRSPYLDNEFVQTVFQAPSSALTSNDVSLNMIADGAANLQNIPTDRGLAGTRAGLSAAAMHMWMEFTFKAEYAYDYGMPQRVVQIDNALSALHLERLFLGRHKFYHFRYWYRHPLAKYVQEILLDPRTLSRPYLDRQLVESMVRNHTRGTANHTLEIHKMLSLELHHRLFVDA